jgi:hypothetical protein
MTSEKAVECAACGREYVSWGQHVRRHGCAQVAVQPCVSCDEEPEPESAPPAWAADLPYQEMACKLGGTVAEMHLIKKMSITTCQLAVKLAEQAASIAVDLCRATIGGDNVELQARLDAVGARSLAVLQKLSNIDAVCEEHASGALMPIERPLLAPPKQAKKHFAFFSIEAVIRDMLQKDPESRGHSWQSSDSWSTGEFRNPPVIINDVTHGARFRSSPASRKALPSEARRKRIAIQAWNDDATVSASYCRCIGRLWGDGRSGLVHFPPFRLSCG